MKYPKVGDEFYWEDNDGMIQEEHCFKIEEENNPDVETMFFTYLSPNGGGVFVTESDILDPDSKEVKDFINSGRKKKITALENAGFRKSEIYKILNVLENEN